jgi:nucleoside-diphosphate-sugar epimerase
MKVVVTGGSGHTGIAIVRDLVEHGYDVLSVDRTPIPEDIAPYKLIDCEDTGAVYSVLTGADAVIHLAAIPRPTFHTPQEVFRVNTMASFNVFEVVATLRIPRVVYISSMSALGFPFFYSSLEPQYVPIDEAHPRHPEDAYALSKAIGEDLADACVRRCMGAVSAVSLRLPWVHTPETFAEQLFPNQNDPAFGATNLWSYVDTRDVAQACRLSLTADIDGHEVYFISADNSFMNQDTAPLVRQFYPNADIRKGFEGNRSLFDCRKAKQQLGYQPAYTWEMYPLPGFKTV